MSAGKPFGDLAEVYDSLIDWPQRLEHESGFYRRWFDPSVQRIVDTACGPGHHAALFHGWGLQVEGADVSSEMIDRARRRYGQPPGLGWAVRSFDRPIESQAPFDAAICVGNSLALADDQAVVRSAIAQMLAVLRPSGLLVVQVLNLWALADGPCRWQKCRRMATEQGELLVVKGVHRSGTRGYVDLVVASLTDPPSMQTESVRFLGLEAAELGQAASDAGAEGIEFFGGYDGRPYRREESGDLIAVAQRREQR